jgi:hypothetical protein
MCQQTLDNQDHVDLGNKLKSGLFLDETLLNYLESQGFSPSVLEQLNSYLQKDILIKSYLDFQSINGISIIEAKLLFQLFNFSYDQFSDFKKQNTSAFLASDQLDKSKSNHNLKFRFKHSLKSEEKDYALILEKDWDEPMIQVKNPYFSDHINFSYRKQCKKYQLYLGGYELSFGQGLLLSHGISFGQGSSFFNSEKSNMQIKPKTNFGEDNYSFGVALKFRAKHSSLIYVSRRLLDGTYTAGEMPYFTIRHGGIHNPPSGLLYKNNIIQYKLGACRDFTLRKVRIEKGVHLQALNPSYKRIVKPNLWSHTAIKYTQQNIRLFGEFATKYTNKIAYTALVGISKSIAYGSGISLVVQKNSEHFKGIYVNHLFGYQTNPDLNYFVVFNKKIKSRVNSFIRYESSLKKGTPNTLQAGFNIKKRKNWVLDFRSKFNQINQTETFNTALQFRKYITQGMELRSRLHVNTSFEAVKPSKNVLLAEDLIYTPLQKQYSFKFRLAYYLQENSANNVFAFENSPIGQYSLKQYNQTGLRYTINIRWKWLHKTLELKHHNWISKTKANIFPLELQFRSSLSSDD